jgi:DNA-binding transcriptional regulator YiaG
VLRELNAGRLAPAAAVAASGLLTKPGVPELHRAALAAALGHQADTRPDKPRTRQRTPARTSRPDTATAVRRLRTRHPDMSPADIAARLGVTDRTVRRHLAVPQEPAPAAA